jgi:hypothetical protein
MLLAMRVASEAMACVAAGSSTRSTSSASRTVRRHGARRRSAGEPALACFRGSIRRWRGIRWMRSWPSRTAQATLAPGDSDSAARDRYAARRGAFLGVMVTVAVHAMMRRPSGGCSDTGHLVVMEAPAPRAGRSTLSDHRLCARFRGIWEGWRHGSARPPPDPMRPAWRRLRGRGLIRNGAELAQDSSGD